MNQKQKARYEKLVQAFNASRTARGPHERAWNDYAALYANQMDQARQTTTSPRNVNLAFQTVEIIVSAATERYPKIYASARKKDAVGRARNAEMILDHWERTHYTNLEVEFGHRDAAIFGNGFLKTAWMREASRSVEPDPIELQKMLAGRDRLAQELGMPYLSDKDVYEYLKAINAQTISNHPLTRRISPFDVWVDMQARSMRDIAWFSHRYRRPIEEIRNDPGYSFKQRRRFEEVDGPQQYDGRLFGADAVPSGGLAFGDIIELWDIVEEQLYIVGFNQMSDPDKVLYAGDYPYAVGLPFTTMSFYQLPDQIYSMSVIELIAPLQQELNDIRDEQTAARRRMRQKFATLEGVLDDEAIEELQSDVEGAVVQLKKEFLDGTGMSVRDAVVPLASMGVNAELYNQSGVVQSDIYNITGVTEYQRGLVSTYRSATEVNTVNDFTSARLARTIRDVHLARLSVARLQIGLAAQFMDSEEVVRIVGEQPELMTNPQAFYDGRNTVFPFNRRDIAGEYDILLEPGSYDPDNKQTRMDNLAQLYQLLSPTPEFNRPKFITDLMEIMGFADPNAYVLPTPPNPAFMPGAQGSQPGGGVAAPGGGRPAGSAPAERAGGITGGLASQGG